MPGSTEKKRKSNGKIALISHFSFHSRASEFLGWKTCPAGTVWRRTEVLYLIIWVGHCRSADTKSCPSAFQALALSQSHQCLNPRVSLVTVFDLLASGFSSSSCLHTPCRSSSSIPLGHQIELGRSRPYVESRRSHCRYHGESVSTAARGHYFFNKFFSPIPLKCGRTDLPPLPFPKSWFICKDY